MATTGPVADALDSSSGTRKRRKKGFIVGLTAAALFAGSISLFNRYMGPGPAPYDIDTRRVNVEHVERDTSAPAASGEAPATPGTAPEPEAVLDTMHNPLFDRLFGQHEVVYTVDANNHPQQIYVKVNEPRPDPFSPSHQKLKYDSLSNIISNIYGEEPLEQHKSHIGKLIEENTALVDGCPDLVYPGNLVDITANMTDAANCNVLPLFEQYLTGISYDSAPIVAADVDTANHSRMAYKGPCPVVKHVPAVAKKQALEREVLRDAIGTLAELEAPESTGHPATSPCPPALRQKLKNISEQFDGVLAPRYEKGTATLQTAADKFHDLYDRAKADGLTAQEKLDLHSYFDSTSAVRGDTSKLITELKTLYDDYVRCDHSNDPAAQHIKKYIDGLQMLNVSLDDLIHTADAQPTVESGIAAAPVPAPEARRPAVEERAPVSASASGNHILIGKNKKEMVDLNTVLEQAQKSAKNEGTPIIVYDEKVSFYARQTDGEKLELHRVGISRLPLSDEFSVGSELVFNHNGKPQKNPKSHDAYHFGDVVDGKHAKTLGVDTAAHFKTNFAPEVKYQVPLYPQGYTHTTWVADVLGSTKVKIDHETMKASFSIPNLVALTTADDVPVAYLAIVPHKTFGDYLKSAAIHSAMFGAGGFVVDYFNIDFIKPFMGQGPPIPHPRN